MDELTDIIPDEVPLCKPFADDIMLIDKINKGVNQRLGMWRSTPDSKSLRTRETKYTATLVSIRTFKLG